MVHMFSCMRTYVRRTYVRLCTKKKEGIFISSFSPILWRPACIAYVVAHCLQVGKVCGNSEYNCLYTRIMAIFLRHTLLVRHIIETTDERQTPARKSTGFYLYSCELCEKNLSIPLYSSEQILS